MYFHPCIQRTEPHVTITVFDLKTFELRDFRRDIYLSEAEYGEMSRNDVTFADVCKMLLKYMYMACSFLKNTRVYKYQIKRFKFLLMVTLQKKSES